MVPRTYSRRPRRSNHDDEHSAEGDPPEWEGGGGRGDTGAAGGANDEVEEVTSVRPAPARTSRRNTGLSQITADRPIFTLSVAADLLGLHPRTLRIYEEKGLVVPARTEGNRRRYSQNDINRFQAIRRLTQYGVNLEGVRIILDMAEELTALGGDPNAVIERNMEALDNEE